MKNKSLWSLIVAAIILTGPMYVYARVNDHLEAKLDEFQSTLNLTAAQVKQVRPILNDFMNKMEVLSDQVMAPDRAEVQRARIKYDLEQQLSQILSHEQLTNYNIKKGSDLIPRELSAEHTQG